jgi:hypothetical protein
MGDDNLNCQIIPGPQAVRKLSALAAALPEATASCSQEHPLIARSFRRRGQLFPSGVLTQDGDQLGLQLGQQFFGLLGSSDG